MRTRVTRSGPERAFNPRQNYNRHEEPEHRAPRYNSPGRYRDYDYNNRELKDNFNVSRDFSYRDYNQGREFTPREYQNREYNRDYQNSKDFNNPREYTNPREYVNNTRDYPNNSRDFQVVTREYHQNSREFNGPREFQNSREFNSREYSNNRYYPQNNREFRYREYPQNNRIYQQNNREIIDYDKPYQERRYYDRQGPYDRRNIPRQEVRRVEGQGYEFETKRVSGPMRRTGGQGQKVHRTKVFIGNLSGEVTQEQLTSKFSTFGPINRIDFRRKFAFVDYVRSKDADTAIREMHNKLIWGSWLKVQPHIEQQKKMSTREPKPSFQITVTNLDQSVSWQDLKDFARQAGDVNYASIIIKGDKRFGLIEYTNDESVKKAMKDLNGKKIVTNKLELIHVPVSEFLKKLGFNHEGLLVEAAEEEGESNVSNQQNEFNFDENDRYNNDTFEAEDNSKSPSPNNMSNKDDLYQEGNLDSVDYN